jgi:hypothetical protein
MNEKIKEINFEELWNKVREMKEKTVLADEACTLLDRLYDDRVAFNVEDDYGKTYDGDCDSVIYTCDLKDFARNKAIETRDKCILDILKICREIGEYNGVDFKNYVPGELE